MSAKTVFNLVYWPLFLLFNALYFFLMWKRVLPRAIHDWHQFLFLGCNLFAVALASWACRVAGVSQKAEEIERYQRVGTRHANFVERVEYKTMAQWQILLCLLFFLAATLGCGFLAFSAFSSRNFTRDFWTGVLGVQVFGTMLMWCVVLASDAEHNVLADEKGVHGSTLPFFRTKIVPWDEVQHMEKIVKRDVEGTIYSTAALFRDAMHVEQMRVFLRVADEEAITKFFEVVIENAGLQKQS